MIVPLYSPLLRMPIQQQMILGLTHGWLSFWTVLLRSYTPAQSRTNAHGRPIIANNHNHSEAPVTIESHQPIYIAIRAIDPCIYCCFCYTTDNQDNFENRLLPKVRAIVSPYNLPQVVDGDTMKTQTLCCGISRIARAWLSGFCYGIMWVCELMVCGTARSSY